MNAGLFKLDPLTVTDAEAVLALALDATEPYLDDHRPGGDPLFATVMAIEAAVTAARFLAPSAGQALVTQVHVHKPFILKERRPHVVNLHVVRRRNDEPDFHCTLSSLHDDQPVTHLQALVQFDAPAPEAAFRLSPGPSIRLPVPAVPAGNIYELFFHGPSFQVVAEAQYHAGYIRTRLQQNLPPYHRRSGAVSRMAPLLIEFALQTAGLLEVAANGRMKIPHYIGSIERHLPVDIDTSADVFARAYYESPGQMHTNIDVVDASERLLLRVVEYRTVVLPFTLSGDAISRLRDQFLA